MVTTKSVTPLEIPQDEIRRVDADKRVAVSRLGYIALMRHENLVMVKLRYP